MLISGWQADEPISEEHILILQLRAGNWNKTNRWKDLETIGQAGTTEEEENLIFEYFKSDRKVNTSIKDTTKDTKTTHDPAKKV